MCVCVDVCVEELNQLHYRNDTAFGLRSHNMYFFIFFFEILKDVEILWRAKRNSESSDNNSTLRPAISLDVSPEGLLTLTLLQPYDVC